jgi:hypothetical protein
MHADGLHPTSSSRRSLLRAGGGLAVGGFSLNRSVAGSQVDRPAKTCILIYLLGGPPHQDMFDLKPDAPAEVRGPFQPIPTVVSGLQICEHLPRLALGAERFSLIRSVSHHNSNHTPMIYYTLTGRETAQPELDNDIRPPQPHDFPHIGSVLSRLHRTPSGLPGFVAIPELAIRSSTSGEFKRARTPLRGGGAGFLGASYEGLAVSGEPGTPSGIPAIALPREVAAERFERRLSLLSLLDHRGPVSRPTRTSQEIRDQAVALTGSGAAGRPVFSLDSERPETRDRYGRHRFGQALLLARRLAEAEVPLVAIHFNEMTVCDGWDTHSKNFDALKSELLPMVDQSLSALLEDLEERGLLSQTVVACYGEFGRTPKINANAGRDHWGDCSTTLLAGGPIRPGRVIGASDKLAAFPITEPIDPVDVQATLYHCCGLEPETTILDPLNRPWAISTGRVVRELL